MRKLPRYKYCFVCGRNNQAGLNMIWEETDQGVIGEYLSQEKHCGYIGIIHGGIISALLDECIGWAVGLVEKKMFYTGELKVTFKAPLPVDKKVIIKGYYSNDQAEDKKYRKGYGSIVDDQGTVYATAEGKFFAIPGENNEALLKTLEMPDNIEEEMTVEELWGEPAI